MKQAYKLGKRQQGVSAVGWIAIMGLFGLIVISFFKVFPFYYDNFKVQSALEAVALDETIDPKSKRAIWQSLQKRLYINEVRSINREHVTMSRKDGRTTVTVTYQTEDDYIANLYIGGRFNESIEIER